MLRHRLIRWLSFGDMIVMNAEIARDGTMRTREAGDHFIHNVRIDHDQEYGLSYGKYPAPAGLSIETTPVQRITVSDTFIRGIL